MPPPTLNYEEPVNGLLVRRSLSCGYLEQGITRMLIILAL